MSLTEPEQGDGSDWRGLIAVCLSHEEHLSPREREFIGSIRSRATLSAKQRAWLNKIAADAPGRDLDTLKEALSARLEELAESLLGTPNADTRRRREWRWGSKGSVALVIEDHGGRARGDFFTHKSGRGGGILDLVMHGRSCGLGDAIRFAKHWLGWDVPDYVPRPISENVLAARTAKREQRQR
ncbi:hypothetical protein ACELLULO517_27335 [Acidisoma cellulosilytica]|uniref:Uncharacterized protein n=1 Tax=Acidisoma cellulosilyticum TaxID=2802395 RepID=A0A964E7G6_9PROT|nr:hypothetical protein [Acidisoma cellulosilyticum]MCB8883983.1 hypothetical protein [Acidisoma cellulosilyticum]